MLDAQQAQEIALLVATRRGVDFGAAPFCNLDRGNADAARCTVNQDFLSRFKPRQVMHGVIHGEERTRNGRRRFKRHAFRNARHSVGVGDQAIGEARRTKTDDTVARLEITLDHRPFTAHHTGKLEAQRRAREAIFDRFIRQQTQRVHDIAEVQTRGLNLDIQFIVCRHQRRSCFPAQIAQLPRQIEAELDLRRRIQQRTAWQLIGLDSQPCDIPIASRADRQFGFFIRIEQCRHQDLDARANRQIEQTNSTTDCLVHQRPTEAPQGSIGNALHSRIQAGALR
ncbi:hypothetical protein D3C84_374920 [compost metagenome]